MSRNLHVSTPKEQLAAAIDLDKLRTPGAHHVPVLSAEVLLQAKEDIGRGTSQMIEALVPAMQAAAEVVRKMRQTLEQAGIVAEEPPTDPRERALWARRNRGTGPSTPAAWHRR